MEATNTTIDYKALFVPSWLPADSQQPAILEALVARATVDALFAERAVSIFGNPNQRPLATFLALTGPSAYDGMAAMFPAASSRTVAREPVLPSAIDYAIDLVVERMERHVHEGIEELIHEVRQAKEGTYKGDLPATVVDFWTLVQASESSQVLRMGSDRRYPAQPVVMPDGSRRLWQTTKDGTPAQAGIAFGWRADPYRRANAEALAKLGLSKKAKAGVGAADSGNGDGAVAASTVVPPDAEEGVTA